MKNIRQVNQTYQARNNTKAVKNSSIIIMNRNKQKHQEKPNKIMKTKIKKLKIRMKMKKVAALQNDRGR